MNIDLAEVTEVSLNKYMFASDKMNMMNIVPGDTCETYETAPLAAMPASTLSEEELHTLFESAINSRLLAMREQMERISGPLAPFTESQLASYETDILQVVDTPIKRAFLFYGSWRKILLYSSLGLMLAALGFDIMGLIVLYAR